MITLIFILYSIHAILYLFVYSPDGNLLVSQGGEPDYLITIWNWTKRRILLRTKSYSNDVHRVKFSPYVTGQLTSCGKSWLITINLLRFNYLILKKAWRILNSGRWPLLLLA